MSVQVTVFEPPPRAELCKFRLSRPALPGRAGYFGSAAEAAGHALFEVLFAIEHVDSVGCEHDLIVLCKRDRHAPWGPVIDEAQSSVSPRMCTAASSEEKRTLTS